VRIHSRTDVGKVRQNNEDAIAVDEGLGIAVLADGMGGLNAGEVAAGVAVKIAIERLRNGDRNRDLDATLQAAFREANRRVYDLSNADSDLHGMGTTLVAAVAEPDRCTTAHVGDSRAYLFRRGKLTRMTTDHSLVYELVMQGVISVDEARASPNRNIITRAIGIEPEVRCDINRVLVEPGALVLICSDGLTDMLTDGDIAAHCGQLAGDPEGLIGSLVGEANSRGGYDNISIIAIAW
jgi:PPM family protein phosphatase